jgi:hypothetical protein
MRTPRDGRRQYRHRHGVQFLAYQALSNSRSTDLGLDRSSIAMLCTPDVPQGLHESGVAVSGLALTLMWSVEGLARQAQARSLWLSVQDACTEALDRASF